jgi:hypothetical protein
LEHLDRSDTDLIDKPDNYGVAEAITGGLTQWIEHLNAFEFSKANRKNELELWEALI